MAIRGDLGYTNMTIINDLQPDTARPTINHRLSVAPMLDWT